MRSSHRSAPAPGSHRRTGQRGFAPWLSRTFRACAAGIAVTLVLVTTTTFATAGTPGSDPRNGSWVGGLLLDPGPEHLVLWRLPGSGGRLGTCIDANRDGPLHGPYMRHQAINDPVYAELNHLFANAATSDVRLAELSALNSAKYDRVDKQQQWSYLVNGQGGTSVADAHAMLQAAEDRAGPYSVAVSWPDSDVEPGEAYVATVSVTSANGTPVVGASVSIASAGASLTRTIVSTDRSGRAEVGFTIRPGTATTFSITASVQSWTEVDTYRSDGEQEMLVAGAPSTQTGRHTGTVTRTRAVNLVKVAAGDATGRPVPGYVYEIDDAAGQVIRRPVVSGSSPAAAPIGDLRTGVVYRARELAVPTGATLYIPSKSTTEFVVPPGTTPWTLVASDPVVPTPVVTTQVSAERAVVGGRLDDEVLVDGDDGEDGTITATLFGPVPPPASGACTDLDLAQFTAAPRRVFTVAVDGRRNGGNGHYRVTGPLIEQPGCWGWAERLQLRPSGATAESAPTAPHESALVTRPAVVTRASADVAAAGSTLTDRVTVTGTNGFDATLRATLYGPLPADAISGCARWTTAEWQSAIARRVGALVAGSATVSVRGDGAYVVAPVVVPVAGCYTYAEALVLAGWPAAGATSPPGVRDESTVVVRPVITTSAEADGSGRLRDRVTVTGFAGLRGTVTGRVLGPLAPRDGSCHGLDWTFAPVAAQVSPLAVAGGATGSTTPAQVRTSGCYTFAESLYAGGATQPLAVSAPGIDAETVLVLRSPASHSSIPLARTGDPARRELTIGLVTVVAGVIVFMLGVRRNR